MNVSLKNYSREPDYRSSAHHNSEMRTGLRSPVFIMRGFL